MKRRHKREPCEDLGARDFHCRQCGLDYSVPWDDIFEMQECIFGHIGYEWPIDFVFCPQCGTQAWEDLSFGDDAADGDDNIPF